jgi:hypothetical protein
MCALRRVFFHQRQIGRTERPLCIADIAGIALSCFRHPQCDERKPLPCTALSQSKCMTGSKRDVEVFTEALQLSASERAAYLDRACGSDGEPPPSALIGVRPTVDPSPIPAHPEKADSHHLPRSAAAPASLWHHRESQNPSTIGRFDGHKSCRPRSKLQVLPWRQVEQSRAGKPGVRPDRLPEFPPQSNSASGKRAYTRRAILPAKGNSLLRGVSELNGRMNRQYASRLVLSMSS